MGAVSCLGPSPPPTGWAPLLPPRPLPLDLTWCPDRAPCAPLSSTAPRLGSGLRPGERCCLWALFSPSRTLAGTWGLQGRLEVEVGADGGPAHGGAEPAPFQPFALGVLGGPGSSLSTRCWAPGPVLRDLFRAYWAQGESGEAEGGPAAECELKPQGSVALSRCFLQHLRRPALWPLPCGAGTPVCRVPVPQGWAFPRLVSSPAWPPGGISALCWPGRSGCHQPQPVSCLFFLNFMYLLFCVLWALLLHEQLR